MAQQQQVLERLVLDLVTFNQEAERQLQALCQAGFLEEEYDRISGLAASNLKALEQMLENPAAKMTSDAVANLVTLYKAEVRDQILAVQARLYSGRQLRLRMKEVLRTRLAEVSSRLQAERQSSQRYLRTQIDRVKQIRAEIDQLQADSLARFGKILQIEGENWRSEIFEEILEDYSAALPAIFNRHLFEDAPDFQRSVEPQTASKVPQSTNMSPSGLVVPDSAAQSASPEAPTSRPVEATSFSGMSETSGVLGTSGVSETSGMSDLAEALDKPSLAQNGLGQKTNGSSQKLDQVSGWSSDLSSGADDEVTPVMDQATDGENGSPVSKDQISDGEGERVSRADRVPEGEDGTVPTTSQVPHGDHAQEAEPTPKKMPSTTQPTIVPDSAEVIALTAQLQGIAIETEKVTAQLRSLLASAEVVSARLRRLQSPEGRDREGNDSTK